MWQFLGRSFFVKVCDCVQIESVTLCSAGGKNASLAQPFTFWQIKIVILNNESDSIFIKSQAPQIYHIMK